MPRCVFLVLAHERRRIPHFGVTAHPTAEWSAQQLRDAFPWDTAPRYLLRDRDRIFGHDFTKQVREMGIKPVLSAPRSPCQRAYVERVIGTLRRECLEVIVFHEASLYRHVKSFVAYYHESRTHLSLAKDAPESRPVQRPEVGRIVAIPQLGGLHHRYERCAAGDRDGTAAVARTFAVLSVTDAIPALRSVPATEYFSRPKPPDRRSQIEPSLTARHHFDRKA